MGIGSEGVMKKRERAGERESEGDDKGVGWGPKPGQQVAPVPPEAQQTDEEAQRGREEREEPPRQDKEAEGGSEGGNGGMGRPGIGT